MPRRIVHTMSNAQRGAALAVIATAMMLVTVACLKVRLGFGPVGDVLIGWTAFAVLTVAYGSLISVVANIVRRFLTVERAYIFGGLFAGAALLGLLAGFGVAKLLAGLILWTAAWWGATIAAFFARDRHGPGRRPYVLLTLSIIVTLGVVNVAVAPLQAEPDDASERPVLKFLPPVRNAVVDFRYGSGDDARRDGRYGRDARVRTAPVDLTMLLPNQRGVRKFVHARYWGIDVAAAPVNARVWLPEGTERVPLALMMHGAGVDESSEDGLAYLGEQLASHGILAVSIDANFLSGPWIRESDGAVAARERLALAHLDALDSLDRDPRSPLAGRIDRQNIVLIGHSRGAEALSALAMNHGLILASPVPTIGLDTPLSIRAVVALSPSEGLLLPNGRDIALEDVSYLLVRGSQDADVPPEAGAGQYTRVTWPGSRTDFKSAVVLEGANHSQFNARWGRRDIPPPLGWLLRDEPVLEGRLQRELTIATTLAFLEDVIAERPGNFRHFQAQVDTLSTLSGVPIRRRIQSARSTMLATFEQDADPFHGDLPGVQLEAQGFSSWREWRRRRTGNSMVQLVWPAQADSARFTLTLAEGSAAPTLGRGIQLAFSAVGPAGPQEIHVVVETQDGRRTAATVRVAADPEFSQRAQRYRSRFLEQQLVLGTFPSLHTYVVPLDALGGLGRLRRIQFVMPAGRGGALVLDDIGLRPPLDDHDAVR